MIHYLLRHPAIDSAGRCIGRTDLPLNPAGRASLAGLVETASQWGLRTVISSDLQRCLAVAEAMQSKLGCPMQIDHRWSEMNFGEWDGQSWDLIQADHPDRLAHWCDHYVDESPPGGETFAQVVLRVSAAYADLPPFPALICTHAGAMRALACHLGLTTPQSMFAWDLPFGSCVHLNVDARTLHPAPPQPSGETLP